MAIALMPGPPTPTTCSRCGVDEVERDAHGESIIAAATRSISVDQRAAAVTIAERAADGDMSASVDGFDISSATQAQVGPP